MPHLLSTVDAKAFVVICNPGKHFPLRDRPQLAVLAMEAIDSWANVESVQMHVFVNLMGGQKSLASSIYLGLEGQGPKTKAMTVAAEQTLLGDELRVLRAVLRVTKTNQKSRDKLAHWCWGTSPQLLDALLLMHPEALLSAVTDMHFREKVYVYWESDFSDIASANYRLCGYYNKFNAALAADPIARLKLFHELSQEPEIQERLDRPASPA